MRSYTLQVTVISMKSVRSSRWARPAAYAFCTLGLLTPALAQTSSGSAPAARKQVDQKRKAPKPVPKEQPGRVVTAGPSKPSPTPVQLKPEPSQPGWAKVCGKDPKAQAETCYTTRDFVSKEDRRVLSVAIYDVKSPKPKSPARNS